MFSPQSNNLYRLLLKKNQPLTVIQIAKQLKVVPNAVYFLIEPLIKTGLVEEILSYPKKFKAKSFEEGMSLFLLEQSFQFEKQFGETQNKNRTAANLEQVFIQGRDELMNYAADELNTSHKTVNLLRSGHEMPPETLLACNQAIQRGVKLRMLIQDYDESNHDQVSAWIKNGFQVKKTSISNLRIQIYDSEVLYFMSYKHSSSDMDTGIRIVYPPFATVMEKSFDKWWDEGIRV